MATANANIELRSFNKKNNKETRSSYYYISVIDLLNGYISKSKELKLTQNQTDALKELIEYIKNLDSDTTVKGQSPDEVEQNFNKKEKQLNTDYKTIKDTFDTITGTNQSQMRNDFYRELDQSYKILHKDLVNYKQLHSVYRKNNNKLGMNRTFRNTRSSYKNNNRLHRERGNNTRRANNLKYQFEIAKILTNISVSLGGSDHGNFNAFGNFHVIDLIKLLYNLIDNEAIKSVFVVDDKHPDYEKSYYVKLYKYKIILEDYDYEKIKTLHRLEGEKIDKKKVEEYCNTIIKIRYLISYFIKTYNDHILILIQNINNTTKKLKTVNKAIENLNSFFNSLLLTKEEKEDNRTKLNAEKNKLETEKQELEDKYNLFKHNMSRIHINCKIAFNSLNKLYYYIGCNDINNNGDLEEKLPNNTPGSELDSKIEKM